MSPGDGGGGETDGGDGDDGLGLGEVVDDHGGDPLADDPAFDRSEADLDANPPPEYAIEGLSGQRDPTSDERAAYRERFGYLRTFFRSRPGEYAGYQQTLNQARVGAAYDEYLARGVRLAAAVGVVGLLAGVAVATLLAEVGAFGAVRNEVGLAAGVAAFLRANRVLVGSAVVTLATGTLFAAATWLGYRYYPRARVVTRTQQVNVTLPHAIVYMYALSHGGADLTTAVRSVADAEETYGEVAREFDQVVRDVDVFGNDLITALENVRNLTPSDSLESFLDDLLSVLESGGQVTPFLETQARESLEEAMDEQTEFLETLALLSEVFIVGFVAAPLFLVVILVVISLVGGQTLTQLSVLVYGVMPIGMAMFLVLVDTLSEPFRESSRVAAPDRTDHLTASPPEDDERLAAYRRVQRRDRLRDRLRDPLAPFRRDPPYVLALSVPAAVLVAVGAVVSGAATPSVDAMVAAPVVTTLWLVVAPLVVATLPLSYYHERRARRERRLARRFPDTLNILSSANKMGIGLTSGLALVVRSTSGVVAGELRKVRNDILWNHSTSDALRAFGARSRVPQLARTTNLLAEGVESTSDLSRVLTVAAEDARARYKLERARTREMSSYIAIVVIGYLVYLLVVLLLEANYLTPIADAARQQAEYGGGVESPLTFTNVPVATYRAVFLHSAVIQGFGSGLLAGKLSDDSVRSGLKYGLALVILAAIAFTVV
ncbi:type II secretion system F family protein [Halorarius halobius]|uniref:type II secretion system F family protein n=1 Tax=Halorarius halobius TaxID=2962671 RepID=UPI0020CF5AA8|nr:type II secretion system F family protein [Halorarius halobius]